jgi:hypothetical protein
MSIVLSSIIAASHFGVLPSSKASWAWWAPNEGSWLDDGRGKSAYRLASDGEVETEVLGEG